jgi:hypothetical protein
MKPRANIRKGGKYAEAREWALDLIANSTNPTASEIADMMVEQFKAPKPNMSHCITGLVRNGAVKIVGTTTHKGKRTHILAAVRRLRSASAPPPAVPEPATYESTPGDVALAITLTFRGADGVPLVVTASMSEAKNAYNALHKIFGAT